MRKYIRNGQSYAEFSEKANIQLLRTSAEDYMDFWLDFMKDLFEEVYKLKDSELRSKALELNEFRDRMNDIFVTGRERNPGTLQ